MLRFLREGSCASQGSADHSGGIPKRAQNRAEEGTAKMIRWAIIFLVIALIAALFGFGGIAAGAAGIAKVLFYIFAIIFVISLVAGLVKRPS